MRIFEYFLLRSDEMIRMIKQASKPRSYASSLGGNNLEALFISGKSVVKCPKLSVTKKVIWYIFKLNEYILNHLVKMVRVH